MTFWAWVVFLLATGYTIWDGVRRTMGAKTMEGFFAAGRSIPWWAAGLSVMATQLSAITIISGVGMGYENGLEWVQFYFALPFAMVILCIWFVPLFRRHPILTAYEYLERRFGPVTRSLTSLAFLISRCLAFGVVLYAPSVVFSVMTGLPVTWTVVAVGLITTTYTVLGGVGGVVWTDVKQMLVIVFGIVACLCVVGWQAVQDVGLAGILPVLGASRHINAVEIWNPAWSFMPGVANSFWSDKYNVWTGLFGTLFLFLSYFGCDQVQVQSILSSKSVDASRRALLMSAFTKVPLQLLVLLLGALMFLTISLGQDQLMWDPRDRNRALSAEQQQQLAAIGVEHATAVQERQAALRAFATNGDAAAVEAAVAKAKSVREQARKVVFADDIAKAQARGETFKVPSDSNYVFPHFIFHDLPAPLTGLLIAAIFAAAISSAAGALSSLTSASMIDFYQRWFDRGASQERQLATSRLVMCGWGVLATLAALWLGEGPLLERVNEVGSWFYGSILGVFVIALAIPRAGGLAASVGLIAGLLSVFAVHWTVEVAFLWYNLIGCVGAVAAGWLVSVVVPRAPTLA